MLRDEAEVGEYLFISESEGRLSYLESDIDYELHDHVFDIAVDDGSDEDIIKL